MFTSLTTILIVCVVLTAIIIVGLEQDAYGFPAFATILAAITYYPLLKMITIPMLCFAIISYLTIGGLWSIWRWKNYILEQVKKARNNPSHFPTYQLNPQYNKGRILAWIAYWPWSLLWEFTRDLVSCIYNNLIGIYQNISNKAIGEIEELEERNKHK